MYKKQCKKVKNIYKKRGKLLRKQNIYRKQNWNKHIKSKSP